MEIFFCLYLYHLNLELLLLDSINRFLERERYEAKDLFDFLVEREGLVLKGGVLSGDDTLLEKPYSQPYKSELLGYYWNNKQKKVMWGLPLITLYYTSPNGLKVPINYRLYDKREGKSKNQYLQPIFRTSFEKVKIK